MKLQIENLIKANVPSFYIEIDGINAPLRVSQFWGEEGFSQLFHFSIQIESDILDISPDDAVGQSVTFAIYSNGNIRLFKGIVSHFEFSGIEHDMALYNADINPKTFLLSQNHQSRIFQNLSPIKILEEVLLSAGLTKDDYKISCSADYKPLEYCVQYRETDLDFFNRIAEHFGIFYFFEFSEKVTKLIIGDSSNVYPMISNSDTINFRLRDSIVDYGDFIYEFHFGKSLRPTKHTLRDYNFESPKLDLTQQVQASTPNNLEWYDYPAKYYSEGVGAALARIRQESEECERFNGFGLSNSIRLVPGSVFKLQNHLIQDFNTSFLVSNVVHSGSQPTRDTTQRGTPGYSNEFRFVPSKYLFRPLLRTRKPVVEGGQTATVTGPSGHEIYCDKYGRIKVRFHWDRSDTPNEQSSCWVRVSQNWAGKGWGTIYIPRIGQEVIIDFFEGDPDRPVVTGCVYNGLNMPPYPLPDKQSISTIHSESTIGGSGYNELRLDDLKGSEEIYLQAEKDYNILTKNDKTQTTGGNETLHIKKNRTKTVDVDEKNTVQGNRSESVSKNESINIDQNRNESVGKNESISIGENRNVNISKNDSHDIGDNHTQNIGKDKVVSVGKNMKVSIGKSYALKAADNVLISSDKDITLKCGGASVIMKKNGDIQIKGKNIAIKGSGNITMKGSKVTQN
jgi:type VI secretion system secreted protein VgrG